MKLQGVYDIVVVGLRNKEKDLLVNKRYKNPPIIEALCEFQFESSTSWDIAIPGLIYEKVQDTFPKRLQVQLQASQINPNGVDGEEIVQQSIPLIRFQRTDDLALMQVGPNLLTINHLKPYSSWQNFLPLIERGLAVYREVVNPTGIRTIALRYINRIELPNHPILEEYFEFRPSLTKKLQNINAFIVGIQIPYEDNRDVLNLQLSSIPSEVPDKATMLLDLNYILANQGAITWEDVFKWLETAHNNIIEIFEASITEELKQRFEETN